MSWNAFVKSLLPDEGDDDVFESVGIRLFHIKLFQSLCYVVIIIF